MKSVILSIVIIFSCVSCTIIERAMGVATHESIEIETKISNVEIKPFTVPYGLTELPDTVGKSRPKTTKNSIKFEITTDTELYNYYKNQDKYIQVRCNVNSKAPNKVYSSGYGPFYNNIDISDTYTVNQFLEHSNFIPNHNNKYKYEIYGFFDLKANNLNRNQNTYKQDLRNSEFNDIYCYIIGVNTFSINFQRSNNLAISYDKFHELLKSKEQQ